MSTDALNNVEVIDLDNPPTVRFDVGRPALHVLATTAKGTRAAVATARRMARQYGARVVLLVPNVTSGNTPLEGIAEERSLVVRLESLAASLRPDIAVLVCVCRAPDDIFTALLDKNAVTLVGGTVSLWWPSPEQRLARRLTAQGHDILFVESEAYSDTKR